MKNAKIEPGSKRLISCAEAGRLLNCSDETIRKWYHDGTLEGVRLGKHMLRIHFASVERLMTKGGAA